VSAVSDLRLEIKRLIIESLDLEDIGPEDIADDTPLFGEGLGLDSIDALELVVLVEERFRVQIPNEDVGQVAFASIDALADFILANQPAGARPQA
jgi:acyl carrier protein